MNLKKFQAILVLLIVFISPSYASGIYDSDPAFSPYYAGSVNSEVLHEALDELNYIRWLIGVPNNVTLNSDYTSKAQHAAVLLDAIDTLTHTPGRPADMSEEFYQLAYEGTSNGNLAVVKRIYNGVTEGNITLSYSIKMYMDDSDSSNISRLGHRRWLMNPRLKQTGFGISTRRGYSATYVVEEFSKSETLTPEEYQEYLEWLQWPISDEFITWPANKHEHPLTYFDSQTAWSVTLNRNVFDDCDISSVKVILTHLSDGETWEFSNDYSDGYFNITDNSVAYDECIIFRPEDISDYSGNDSWRVDISGLTRKDGGLGNISYTVRFTDSSTGYEDPSHTLDSGGQNVDSSSGGGCNAGFGIFALLILGIPHVKIIRVGNK